MPPYRGMEANNPMKVFVILIILAILLFLFASSSLAQVDLTPDTPPAAVSSPVTGTSLDNESPSVITIQNTAPSTTTTTTQNVIPVTGTCTDPYIVQNGDMLSGIAALCNTTVAAIRLANPDITNGNLIYAGQQIRIPGAAPLQVQQVPVPVTGGNNQNSAPGTNLNQTAQPTAVPTIPAANTLPVIPAQPASNNPAANEALLPYPLIPSGKELQVQALFFPANTSVNILVGPQSGAQNLIATGITDATGRLVLNILTPSAPDSTTPWVVVVSTNTSQPVQGVSRPFYISGR
jgi:LysM repeat protein